MRPKMRLSWEVGRGVRKLGSCCRNAKEERRRGLLPPALKLDALSLINLCRVLLLTLIVLSHDVHANYGSIVILAPKTMGSGYV